jgi:hypothetical protein
MLFGDACEVTRPVRFHSENTQPPANGKATEVGADAETYRGLGESARKRQDAPRAAWVWSAAPEAGHDG